MSIFLKHPNNKQVIEVDSEIQYRVFIDNGFEVFVPVEEPQKKPKDGLLKRVLKRKGL